jgi:hypothetical protein
MKHGLGPTVKEPLQQASFTDDDLSRITAAHPTNKVISLAHIAHAQLVKGLTADGLHLTMRDGTFHRLLWLPRDPARQILMPTLKSRLGNRFTAGFTPGN